MFKMLSVLDAPDIFNKPYMVMVPNTKKGPDVCAPYLFDSKEEAEDFIRSLTKPVTDEYWWQKDRNDRDIA